MKGDSWRNGTLVVLVLSALLVGMAVGAVLPPRARAAAPMSVAVTPIALAGWRA